MTRQYVKMAMLAMSVPMVFSGPLPGQLKPEQAQPAQTAAARNESTPNANEDTDAGLPQLRKRNPRYRIEQDDILDLSFRYTPEFDQEVTVQPDGYVQLKGIENDVHVQGLTIPEAIETLKKAYANVLNNPEISVVLRDFEKPYFIAGGAGGKARQV